MKEKGMCLVRKKLSEIAVSEEGQRALEALAIKPDAEIDYSDIPPLPDDFFEKAQVGVFYRPVKRAVPIRLDADVLDWLQAQGSDYHPRANQILREAMLADLRRTKRAV